MVGRKDIVCYRRLKQSIMAKCNLCYCFI